MRDQWLESLKKSIDELFKAKKKGTDFVDRSVIGGGQGNAQFETQTLPPSKEDMEQAGDRARELQEREKTNNPEAAAERARITKPEANPRAASEARFRKRHDEYVAWADRVGPEKARKEEHKHFPERVGRFRDLKEHFQEKHGLTEEAAHQAASTMLSSADSKQHADKIARAFMKNKD